MSTMYFAKLNFTSEVYQIYEDRTVLDRLILRLFSSLNEDDVILKKRSSEPFGNTAGTPESSGGTRLRRHAQQRKKWE